LVNNLTSPFFKSLKTIFIEIEKVYILIKFIYSTMSKRGSSAIEVSVLIFIIAAVLIGYVILIPEDIREDLLDDDEDTDGTTTIDGTDTTALLSVSPGELSPSRSSKQIYGMDPIKIYSRIEVETQILANSLSVARSLIHNDFKNVYFDVDNLESLDELELLFLMVENDGKLKVEINDNEIYYGELTSNELPLKIPTNYLLEEDNILKLSTNRPGINIFSANHYALQDVELVQYYLSEETQKTRTFSIDEVDELKTATLTYYISCNTQKEGKLTIYLNTVEVFDDDIFCEYLEQRELVLDDDYLRTTNTLMFEIDEGDYNIDEIDVEMLMSAKDYPSYTFEIDTDDYEDISSGEKEVYLSMAFGDDSSHKEATIYVQEHSFKIDTYDTDYEKEISSYVDNGANVIKIQPSITFDVDNLKVYLK